MLLMREVMVDAWPWKMSNGLAQTYAAPMLAIALVAWRSSRRTRWSSLVSVGPAFSALGVAVVVSSIRHRSVVGPTGVREATWYAAWLGVAIVGLATTLGAVRSRVAVSQRFEADRSV